MAWHDTLLDASYRGVPLQLVADDLDARRALAAHGMPYRDGDTVEDLGREARRWQLKAVVYGDAYEAALQALLAALDTPGAAPFVHPVYGPLTVVAESWKVTHQADRPDYAEVALVLVESSEDPAFFQRVFATAEGAMASAAASGPGWQDQVRDLFARVDSLVAQVQGYLGGGWVGLAERLLGLPGIGVRLGQLRSQTLGVLSGLAALAGQDAPAFDPLGAPARVPVAVRDAVAGTVPTATVVAVDGTPSDALDVHGLLTAAMLPLRIPGDDELPPVAVRAWATILDAARRSDTPVLAGSDAVGTPVDVPMGYPADDALTANALGLVLLGVTEQAMALASAVGTVLDAERQALTLTPPDIERLTNQARALIEGAIILHRRLLSVEPARQAIEPLRNVAALLQAGARMVILARPPLTARVVETDTCLRLLAHRWYGDHRRAVELLRLNPQLRAPYAIARGEVLRAYAA